MKNACVIRWKMPAANAPTPSAEEHVAELDDRRVREHLLDVVLRQADRRGEERGERADRARPRRSASGAQLEERGRARDHVDAGRHHRRGVDQRGDRRRACHRVRQPDVQRESARDLPVAPTNSSRQIAVTVRAAPIGRVRRAAAAKTVREVERCRSPRRSATSPSMKPKSPMRLTMNAFLPASARDFFVEPEADQQVGAEADAFPADEQQQVVVAEHQHQHRRT